MLSCRLDPRLTTRQLPDLDIVRGVMLPIDILPHVLIPLNLTLQHLNYPQQPLPTTLDVIYDSNLSRHFLYEPHDHLVIDAKIPRRVHVESGLPGNFPNLTPLVEICHLPAVIGPNQRRLKRAVELLLNHLLRHASITLVLYLRVTNHGCPIIPLRPIVARNPHLTEPLWILLRHLIELIPMILTACRIDEHRPPIVLSQDRPEVIPRTWVLQRILREYATYRISAYQTINVISSYHLIHGTIREGDPHLRLVPISDELWREVVDESPPLLGEPIPHDCPPLLICRQQVPIHPNPLQVLHSHDIDPQQILPGSPVPQVDRPQIILLLDYVIPRWELILARNIIVWEDDVCHTMSPSLSRPVSCSSRPWSRSPSPSR